MDKIMIRDLTLDAVIGTLQRERTAPQKLILNIELFCDTRKAGKSDDLSDAVDYSAVEDAVIRTVEQSSFQLLESLCRAVADTCLGFPGVQKASVLIDKPGAAKRARSIALFIEREKDAQKME